MNDDAWQSPRTEAIELGLQLKQARQLAELSLFQFCAEIGVLDPPTLSRIERGMALPDHLEGRKLTEWMLQHLPGFEAPVARTTDPETSHEAARSVSLETLNYVQQWWLSHLERALGRNMEQLMIDGRPEGYHFTDEGARRHYWGAKVSDSGFRTRRKEMVDAGYIEDSGVRVPINTGRRAIVWQLTSKYIEEASAQ